MPWRCAIALRRMTSASVAIFAILTGRMLVPPAADHVASLKREEERGQRLIDGCLPQRRHKLVVAEGAVSTTVVAISPSGPGLFQLSWRSSCCSFASFATPASVAVSNE
jgi:hypothetical protein